MYHIIANPASQSGAGRHKIRTLTDLMMKAGLETTLHLTRHAGHAGELAASLPLTEEDCLIIVGGDGSIDETINGLPLPAAAPIALLPAGSGNDFARGLKISHKPEVLVEQLKNKVEPIPVDLADVVRYGNDTISPDPHRFAVTCGIGMDAEICLELEKGRMKSICNRLHVGKLSYLIVGIRTLFRTGRKKRASIKLTLDDNREYHFKDVAFVSVHNLPYEGGGFPFCPKASPSDGMLDICVVHVPCRLLLIPILIANLCGGNHAIFRSWVSLLRSGTVHADSDRPLTFHNDGEPIADQIGFHARALPAVIRTIK